MRILLFLILFLSILPSQASAHVLKSDSTVGAVIHVTPDDDPVAGEPTDFYFEFKDTENKFKPENCNCQGAILQNGTEIYSSSLFQNSTNPSLENASFSFTFPEKNIYKVKVTGNPTTPGAFEPFTLEWDIRVAREAETPGTSQETAKEEQPSWLVRHIPHTIGIIIMLGFVGYALYTNQLKGKRKSK